MEPDLGDTEEDKIDHISTVTHSVDQVPRSPTNNHTKDELVSQRTRIEHAQVEIRDHPHSNHNQRRESKIVCKQAKSGPTILDIVECQVIAYHRDKIAAIRRAQVLHNQRLCPLVKSNHDNDGE